MAGSTVKLLGVSGLFSLVLSQSCLSGRDLAVPQQRVDLDYCNHYSELSCCTAESDKKIGSTPNNAAHLGAYLFDWSQCGALSTRCEAFIRAWGCYDRCDPYQEPFSEKTWTDVSTYIGVPVCKDYCVSFFDACKEDNACVVNWLTDYSFNETLGYGSCAEGTLCPSFAEIYDNPQGLCDTMFGSDFHYSENDDNCVRFDWAATAAENPNKGLEYEPWTESFCADAEVEPKFKKEKDYVAQPECLAGRYLSKPESQDLQVCTQYADMACCDKEHDAKIDPGADQLFGFRWDWCGKLSPQCEKFFVAESCYFECDPYAAAWGVNTVGDDGYRTIYGVPVCSDYCDAWFEACKDEPVCGTEWLVDYVSNGDAYVCADGTNCDSTFAKVYGNSRGLCDILWGSAFYYSEDLDNCVKWHWDGNENPNQFVQKADYSTGYCELSNSSKKLDLTIIILSVALALAIIVVLVLTVILILKKRSSKPAFKEMNDNQVELNTN